MSETYHTVCPRCATVNRQSGAMPAGPLKEWVSRHT